jgi:DNA transformation protein and related proteins
MAKLSDHVNIGKELEKILLSAGIDSIRKLKKIGTKKAFNMVRKVDAGACLNKLYALEGAIQDIRWHDLDEIKKKELKEFFKVLK